MKFILPLIIFFSIYYTGISQTYPASTGTNTGWEYISNVQIGSINNTSTGSDADGNGDDGYDDYTTQTAVLLPGSTYSLAVTISPNTNDYINAWIDWNDNGVFTDAGEAYTLVANTNNAGPHSVSITVPSSAAGTKTRLRVSLKRNAAATSDETYSYGEVEDYTLYIDKDTDGDGIYDITDKDDDNDGILDDDENICLSQSFQNGNFENNLVYPTTYYIKDASNVIGWETTASDNKIEIWKSGFLSVPAYEGTYFAEINANMSARMYQTLTVEPGDVVRWNVAHRGRSGVDTMAIKVGPTGSPTTQQLAATGKTAWVVYSSSYTVPAGVTQIEIGFESIYTASGNASVGNFIDDIQLYVTRTNYCDYDGDGVPNIYDLDSDNDGIADVVEAGGSDPDNDGRIGTGAITDTDGNGVDDNVDAGNGGTALPNADTDGDGIKNYMDIDSDGDGIVDIIEAQATADYATPLNIDANSNGWDDRYDGNAGGTAIGSTDTDGDGTPDYLDLDSDNDGISDFIEAYDTNKDGVADTNPLNIDSDGDGLDNAFDLDGSSSTDTKGPTNGQSPTSFPNDDNSTTSERDWREALSTLPVSLISFDAELIGNDVELRWATASEIDNDYFTVQRSIDNVNFDDVKKIGGNGNSNIIIQYSTYDMDVPRSVLYYRLKQVDFDGTTTYSDVRVVKNSGDNELLIYPNPSNGIFNIETSEPINIIVSSISGRIIEKYQYSKNSKNKLNLSDIAKGVYILTIFSENSTINKRIIIE